MLPLSLLAAWASLGAVSCRLISSASRIFLLRYWPSFANVFALSKSKPWLHFLECSARPDLSHRAWKTSRSCSTTLVDTFFFVSPTYAALPHLQSILWSTPGLLLGGNGHLWLQSMSPRLGVEVKITLMPFLLYIFLSFGPIFGIHGIFTMFLSSFFLYDDADF